MVSAPVAAAQRIIPHKKYRCCCCAAHGSLSPQQQDALNTLPGQLRQPFLETVARERQRYWEAARRAHERRIRSKYGNDGDAHSFEDTMAALERTRSLENIFTRDIVVVRELYGLLKQHILEYPGRVLEFLICSAAPSLSALLLNHHGHDIEIDGPHTAHEWQQRHPFVWTTLRVLQCELQQSGWASRCEFRTNEKEVELYFICDLVGGEA